MSDQPGSGSVIPDRDEVVAAGDTDYEHADEQSDQGVPVGAADATADAERASGDADTVSAEDDEDDEEPEGLTRDEQTDQGVPVGRADLEEDRAAARDGDS